MAKFDIKWSEQVTNDLLQVKSFLKKVDYQNNDQFLKDLISDITDKIENHLSDYPVTRIISGIQLRKFICHHFAVLVATNGNTVRVLRLLNEN